MLFQFGTSAARYAIILARAFETTMRGEPGLYESMNAEPTLYKVSSRATSAIG